MCGDDMFTSSISKIFNMNIYSLIVKLLFSTNASTV